MSACKQATTDKYAICIALVVAAATQEDGNS